MYGMSWLRRYFVTVAHARAGAAAQRTVMLFVAPPPHIGTESDSHPPICHVDDCASILGCFRELLQDLPARAVGRHQALYALAGEHLTRIDVPARIGRGELES